MYSKKEYMKDYMLRRYHQRRAMLVAQLGGRCKECGSIENLELDNKDPTTKRSNYSKIWSCSVAKLEVELPKFQLLCYDCHLKKTLEERPTTPQGSDGKFCFWNF